MAEMQGSEFPTWLAEKLHAVGDDPAAVRAVGIAEATRLCAALLEGGAPGLHFYTLNRSTATREIYENLGTQGRMTCVRPKASLTLGSCFPPSSSVSGRASRPR